MRSWCWTVAPRNRFGIPARLRRSARRASLFAASILSARALCPRAPSQSHSRNPATIRLAPNSTTHGARGRPQYSQQASECVGFDSPMARPICNLCFPSLLLAGKASGVGMASGHAEGGTGAARGHPMAFRHASTGRPPRLPPSPFGPPRSLCGRPSSPSLWKALGGLPRTQGPPPRASSPLGQRFACRLRESCPDAPCSRSRGIRFRRSRRSGRTRGGGGL